jgi:two-component system nitrogen regulation response regulator GlnG/two-component system response regulator HydG
MVHTTQFTQTRADALGEGPRASVLALCITWSAREPHRVGEVLIPPTDGGGVVFGRGDEAKAAEPRALLVRHRGGRTAPQPALTSPKISREALRLAAVEGGIAVQNLGRRTLLCNGHPVQQTTVRPGDVLELERQLQLLCTVRDMSQQGGPAPRFGFGEPDAHGIVGESPAVWRLRETIAFLAPRTDHVLVCGPSGAGKELVCRALHAGSPRRRHTLVSRSAATLPEGLLDAELFGNIDGYPNPGMRARPGLIGEADGSTLFLDEIGEMGEALQAHLLRVLDAGEYQRLGEAKVRQADVRVVAATNRSPDELKHDLLARFGLRLAVPGLDERPEDVPLLVRHLLRSIAQTDADIAARFLDNTQDGPLPRLSSALVAALTQHRFTLHIRELKTLLWEAMRASSGTTVVLPDDLAVVARAPAPTELDAATVRACLERHEWVQQRAWSELGLSNRHALARLMKKLGVEPP